ncbi:MAG: hypothetical protein JSS62_01770 [Verrucomicrobia bacterium]|nr:hypothetical protein [Verrucomicrobiota bacterium]MBS0645659.1 hypothetical protein [Verrucomicrobiota bacterium]
MEEKYNSVGLIAIALYPTHEEVGFTSQGIKRENVFMQKKIILNKILIKDGGSLIFSNSILVKIMAGERSTHFVRIFDQ